MTEPVLLTSDGGVATITLNRPDSLNAMDRPMVESLLATLERLAEDPEVRAVLLTGAGRAFSAGGDRREPLDRSVARHADDEQAAAALAQVGGSSRLLREMPAVTVAVVNGPCVGAALALACAADLRIASSSARFGTAFLAVGLPGDFGITWSLPRVVGEAKAREMLLLGDMLDADAALRHGLVSKVVPPEHLHAEATATADRIRGWSPRAVRLVKEGLNRAGSTTLADAIAFEARGTVACLRSPEVEEVRRNPSGGTGRTGGGRP